MRRLAVVLWILAVGATTYAYTRALVERAHATGKSQLHVFLSSGDELFIWHHAPSWFYPAFWTLVALVCLATVLSWRNQSA
ncbi:hypothetical protein JOF29_005591 [Kribbella aluminosa]|uniref:Transmembrane protein n=1 Tax=Kribbella aluminosa TaxID=416017 RepID=A0ABS4US82_9ACTN|nr:hypothetical protein [Kribbella aluminosa]MBP2354481.1 hypothetical protein [Kribbella aluminosa]